MKRIAGVSGTIRGISSLPTLGEVDPPPKLSDAEQIVIRPQTPGGPEGTREQLERAALQGVEGTLPERIVWKWLEDHGHSYEHQRTEFGGRLVAGGAVVDFFVYDLAAKPVVLRVMGDYWHGPSFPGRQARDDEQAMRLTQQGYIVADLWESDIYEAVLQENLSRYILGEVDKAA